MEQAIGTMEQLESGLQVLMQKIAVLKAIKTRISPSVFSQISPRSVLQSRCEHISITTYSSKLWSFDHSWFESMQSYLAESPVLDK